MAKPDMNAMLKRRMAATQQASELQIGDSAYEKLFQPLAPPPKSNICELPIEKLVPFFTVDIGFKPYSLEKLRAFSMPVILIHTIRTLQRHLVKCRCIRSRKT